MVLTGVWRTDSIKRAARRQAWYNNFENGDGVHTYNPFGRFNPKVRHGAGDEEAQLNLRQVRSEPDQSPVDNKNSIDANLQQPHPAHHSTFPTGPEWEPSPVEGKSRGMEEFEKSQSSAQTEKNAQDSIGAESSRELSREANEDGKPRKRKRAFFGLGKNKDEDSDDFQRTETEKSKKKKKHPKIPFMSQFKAVFFSWINILLIAVPVGIALEYAHVNKIAVFVVNFIAIIPLAAMLSYSTEELAMYIGEVLGGLLNATFGNAVELIVSVIALTQGKVLIVQTSLIGSMLSNLLLVLGMCFFFGGINRPEQHFNITVAQTAASLLALAIGSLIIPTAFQIFADVDSGVVPTSRGTSVLLLVVYACYLLFQLRTHTDMYNEPSQKTPKRSSGKKDAGEAMKGIAMIGAASGAATAGGRVNQENLVQEQEEEEETPNLSIIGALVTLAISTVFIALCAEYMVSAINEVARSVSPEFIGLILLPIVGNAAEHATAVTVAIKDKMDLSIGVAVGSSLQIALLVLPLMVLFSWFGIGKPEVLSLDFDGFLVVILVLSIWLVNYLINDGKSHWLEGVLLMITYLIIAIAAWFYPAKGDVAG
ncbi:Vacuolar calcium ion transporter [Pseudocercospora fuligena]|uniref:Vacuolar calcium ion transporter n=1 Tax=Pseudocercospora fuligena TaxID=685502 RepID=A0A8H6RFN3_9PEZI|nr:Vacuolar calcium ion transporter [Pseudocercospora fuligena]